MIGLGLLVGLGRRLISGVAVSSGLFPSSYYRHLALAALEEEDFPGALEALPYADDPVLVQLLVLRLRMLRDRHEKSLLALRQKGGDVLAPPPDERLRELLAQEERAVAVLSGYEQQALALLRRIR